MVQGNVLGRHSEGASNHFTYVGDGNANRTFVMPPCSKAVFFQANRDPAIVDISAGKYYLYGWRNIGTPGSYGVNCTISGNEITFTGIQTGNNNINNLGEEYTVLFI